MAMIFMDGFDYLTAANFSLKWDSFTGAALNTGIYGRGKATNLGTGTKTLTANIVTGFNGWHLFTGGTMVAQILHKWQDAGTVQVDLRTDATGALFFTRNGTTIGSVAAPSTRLRTNTWYWIETKVTIDPTTGVASVNVNGAVVLAQTGLNTRQSANSFFNQLILTSGGSQGQLADSYHFWDGTAGDVTAFGYGEHLIDTELANAVGSNSAWTPNAAGNNFTKVNEANEDGDTTFVSTLTVNAIDSYGFVNVAPTTGTIGTIAINTIVRVDDGLAHVINHFTKSAAATALSGAVSPNTTYNNQQTFQGTDPNTTVAWTIAGRNAAEFGYKFIS